MTLNEKRTLQTDDFIHYLAEKLPGMFLKLQTKNSSPIPTEEDVKQEKLLLSKLLHDYLQSTSLINEKDNTKSYKSFCSTSTNT